MGDFLEGVVLLFPPDAGGRLLPIAPREGNYCPIVGTMRVRFIEGPPSIEPGHAGRVVLEIETPPGETANLTAGAELEIIEDERVVGFLTVTRLWRRAIAV